MLKLLIVPILLWSLTSEAEIQKEISGNLEGQFRQSENNEDAKEDLFQDWDSENFQMVYGNLNGRVEMGDSRLEANWFARYSQSDLYDPSPTIFGERDPYLATRIFTFPNKLVARDVFKLQHKKQEDNYQFESVLNKLYYEWDYEGHRFMFGRMYVNYGLGEIFNPLNPFNQPTALTSVSQVAQGNDGFSFTFFVDEKHTIQFLLLGDKSIEGYDGKISKTVWAHGEYLVSDDLQMDYVIGEDQKRYKLGGQVSYQLADALVFSQVLYQTEYIDNDPSDHLWDVLFGYDRQLTAKWHVRFEGGYQKADTFLTVDSMERFLPTEYFAALANVYEIHPLVKLNGTIINDIKSGFTYFIAKGTYNFASSMEMEVFGYTPVSKGDDADNVAQKLVTTDIGLAIRAFF